MRLMGVVVVALLVALLSSAPSGEQAGTTVRSELAGESVRLTLPTGEPKGLVVWFHGQGGNVNDRIDGPFLSALRRDGWAIASSNFHAQSWGNPASTEDAALLLQWAREHTGMHPALWVSGSMGGAVSLNAMLHGVPPPPCWYGVKPAIALTRMQAVPGAPGFIRDAFGGPVPQDRNPVANLDVLPLQTRYRVVSSKDDQWLDYHENAGSLISTLGARGADVTELSVQGRHDDPSHWNAPDLVTFANTCLDADPSPAAADGG
jgi:hypothetical protein